jgi:hypothetical protein
VASCRWWNSRFLRGAWLLVAAVVMLPPHAAAEKPVTTVYVTSTPSAGSHASDEVARGLADAARELRDALARKKALRIVEDPAAADVRVEVTNREERDAGEGGYGGIKLTPLGEMIIRFHATFKPRDTGASAKGVRQTAEVDLKGVGPGYWSRAAKDGAERLSKWIADNL